MVGNPVAGRGGAPRKAERFARELERRGHHVDWLLTRRVGEARRRAGELEGRVDCIVVAAGDGTLNEVVNGLSDPSRTPLGHLPLGTANLLAHELGLPHRPEALAELVESGATRRIDLGRIGRSRFLLLASSGFDALVTQRVRRARAKGLGYRGYLLPILRTLASYREPHLRVRIDGREELEGSLVVASNLRNYGGLFSVTDRARCDSGHLDVCVFRSASRLEIPGYVAAAALGRISRLRSVAYREARRVEIEGERPVPVQVDGDYWGTTPVALEIEPRVVPILAPAELSGPRAGTSRSPRRSPGAARARSRVRSARSARRRSRSPDR